MRETALTSDSTESVVSGSPETTRTTSPPSLAAATSVRATSAGSPSAGWTIWSCSSTMSSVGLDVSSDSVSSVAWSAFFVSFLVLLRADSAGSCRWAEPIIATTAAGTSGSMKAVVAFAITVRARTVSRSGSPGPDPTKRIRPGLAFFVRLMRSHSPALVERAAVLLCCSGVDEFARSQIQQFGGEASSELFGVVDRTHHRSADHVGSVLGRHRRA